MSAFYLDERIRTQAICDEFSKSNLYFVVGYVTERHISVNHYCCVIALFNIKVDTTGADPYNQAILHYLESMRRYAATMWGPSLPCMIILLLGPYIAFVGTLSVGLPTHYHSTDTDMQIKVARHLGAFKKAVRTLEKYYQDLPADLVSSPHQSQLFPHCTHFRPLEDIIVQHFEYISQPFPDKLIFFATVSDQQPVCIKFAPCASLERAPALFGLEKIPGRWFMIAMDTLVDECDGFQLHSDSFAHRRHSKRRVHELWSDKTKIMLINFD
ncbi:hypothetical protein J3A83DRAFT_4535898 [Scleroderma citrinum]